MVTLAVASAFELMVSQLSFITGGEDGLNYAVPHALSPGFRLVEERVLGARIDGRLIAYYLIFLSSAALFLLMLRIVNSPQRRQAACEQGQSASTVDASIWPERMLSALADGVKGWTRCTFRVIWAEQPICTTGLAVK